MLVDTEDWKGKGVGGCLVLCVMEGKEKETRNVTSFSNILPRLFQPILLFCIKKNKKKIPYPPSKIYLYTIIFIFPFLLYSYSLFPLFLVSFRLSYVYFHQYFFLSHIPPPFRNFYLYYYLYLHLFIYLFIFLFF